MKRLLVAPARASTGDLRREGIEVLRPNFWVVRVNLLGLEPQKVHQLVKLLRTDPSDRVRKDFSKVETKMWKRYEAKGADRMSKASINVTGGTKDEPTMRALRIRLEKHGFESALVPGPLLLATQGGINPDVTVMPFATSSAFGPTKEILVKSAMVCNSGGIQDPDLDVEHGSSALWTSHSLRRLANTVAQRDAEKTGTSPGEIDIYLGWHEKILLKDMQVHYAAMSIRQRMDKAKITRGL